MLYRCVEYTRNTFLLFGSHFKGNICSRSNEAYLLKETGMSLCLYQKLK